MLEKAKRGEKSWKLPLIMLLFLLLMLLLLSSCVFNSIFQTPYATRAWVDPNMICSTQWRPIEIPDAYEAAVGEDISEMNLGLSLESLSLIAAGGGCRDEIRDFSNLTLMIRVEEAAFDDDAALGDIVAELIPVLEAHEAELHFELTIIAIGLAHPEQQLHRSWRIDYTEAKRAVAAGLDGEDLWLIGQ
jgi:hypothetical protein